MKRKILGVFVTVMFGCMVLSGCKKNVGTPEDNAVVENEDEQAQDTETSEGHTFGYSCIDIYNPYYDVVKESIRGGGLAFFRDREAFPHLVNALLRR